MSKWVRLENGVVREILPRESTVPSVAYWYGGIFAAQCREAPDDADQGWVLDPETGAFAPPPVQEPAFVPPEPDYMAFIAGLMEGYANG